ncbi:DUF4199 domain-containing protein [Flavobacterium sp. JP2137]|uniref:DUF4199 domain-containing protein n=1 Tax=Flavobacterium sp. JP2137 TaxID=3414510 RepID=UPI003D2FE3B3
MKNYSIEFKWAAISTVLAIAWMYLEKNLGYHDEKIGIQILFTNLFSLVLIAVFIIALSEKKKHFFHSVISWKQAFFSGMILTLMITIFFPLVQYITYTQISPDFFDNLLAVVIEKGSMSLESAQTYFSFDNYLKQGAFNNLSLGVVTSACVAYFIQTKNPKK